MEVVVSSTEQLTGKAGAPWVPRAPVRGTQSFVNTMSGVWRRPALTGREVLWRWAAGTPLLALGAWQTSRLWPSLAVDRAALLGMTVFRPVEAFETIQTTISALAPVLLPTALWLLPLLFAVWTLASALGRSSVLRRLDSALNPSLDPTLDTSPNPAMRPFLGAVLGLRALRNAILLLLLWLWWVASRAAAALTISSPARHGHEPNLVLFCALVICGSIALFVGWAAVNWMLDAAPIVAMRSNRAPLPALRSTWRLGASTRGKLVEINMVMGIVKIALLVLALVFSACPLPFEDVATQSFLVNWWVGVLILYCLASDYFHVVRSAAYLALLPE